MSEMIETLISVAVITVLFIVPFSAIGILFTLYLIRKDKDNAAH